MTDSTQAVHPELQASAKKFLRLPLFNRWNLKLVRALFKLQPKPKFPPHIQAEERFIPIQDSQRRLRLCIYKPSTLNAPAPALLWMHGGGLVIGRPEMNAAYVRTLIEALGLVIVSVDYRLAPEAPFPAPLEDGYAALQWLQARAASLGVDAERIAIGGESAGGGLAASLAQWAHDKGEIKLAAQLLVYPMLDDRSALHPTQDSTAWLVWSPAHNRFGWEAYLGQACGSASTPPYAVPAQREHLANLPPAWIGVGTLDLEPIRITRQHERR